MALSVLSTGHRRSREVDSGDAPHEMPEWKRLLLEASSENFIHSAASVCDLRGDGRNLDSGPANTLLSSTCVLH